MPAVSLNKASKTNGNLNFLVKLESQAQMLKFVNSKYTPAFLKADSKADLEYRVIQDFYYKFEKLGVQVYTCETGPLRVGLITGGSIACCVRDWLFIAATPAFYASLSAVIANQATIMDIRRCRDYILTYKLGYEKELNIVENLRGRPFLKVDHLHGATHESISQCDMIPVLDTVDVIIFRSAIGYQCFGWDVQECIRFMDDVPLIHHTPIQYRLEGLVVAQPNEFLARLRSDVTLLRDEIVYKKLVWLVGQRYDYSTSKALLNLSHYMLYDEKPTTRCITISGASGVGKSHAISKMVKGKSVYFYKHDPKAKNLFDGYFGQDIIVIDDLGHYSGDEWIPLIKWLSPLPYMLPVANMKNIGLIPVLASLVVITTNCLSKLFKLPSETVHAIGRRMDVIRLEMTQADLCIYRRSLKNFVTIGGFSRSVFEAYLDGLVDCSVVQFERGSLSGSVVGCISAVMELTPYSKVARKVCDLLGRYTTLTGRISYEGLVTQSYDVWHKINWIPRSLRKTFHSLPQNIKGIIMSRVRSFLRVIRGSIELDSESFKKFVVDAPVFISEGRSDTAISYDISSMDPMRSVECLGSQTPIFDLTPYVVREQKVDKPLVEGTKVGVVKYTISNLEGSLFKWYRETSFERPLYWINGQYRSGAAYMPLSYDLEYTRDQSDWKQTLPQSQHLNRQYLNELLRPSSGVSATVKRREQRKRQKLNQQV